MSSQNDTIALLLKQMDGYNLHRVTVDASGGALASASDSLVTVQQDKIKEELQVLRAQIKAISRNISELGASLGPTVESSVTNRLNVPGGHRFACGFEGRFGRHATACIGCAAITDPFTYVRHGRLG